MTPIQLVFVALAVLTAMVIFDPASAQSTLDVDKKREEDLKQFGPSSIPNPENLRKTAEATFAKPVAEQTDDELRLIAEQSNRYANMVSFIRERYESYSRENYRYDFVQKALRPALDAYGRTANEFISLRNRAFFNLALKAKARGKDIEALLLFRDAFRLSAFNCGKASPPQNCIRWKAEQEIQRLLGLESVKAYVTWE